MKRENEHNPLEIKNLAVGYQEKSIAEDINFEGLPGELIAIIGVNGIGKSTLLRTIGNLQPCISGSVNLKGKRINEYQPLALASELSMVFTESMASKNLSVWELVALGRQPYTNWLGSLTKSDLHKINEALGLLELKPLQLKKCYELSDGQLQRALLARAVAQDTSVMLLDEPTSHLDLYHKVHILKVLKHIALHTDKTIVFTSHEVNMVIQLCDKILVMDGKVNPFDSPENHIKNKSFENLFPSDTVIFDNETTSFIIKK